MTYVLHGDSLPPCLLQNSLQKQQHITSSLPEPVRNIQNITFNIAEFYGCFLNRIGYCEILRSPGSFVKRIDRPIWDVKGMLLDFFFLKISKSLLFNCFVGLTYSPAPSTSVVPLPPRISEFESN